MLLGQGFSYTRRVYLFQSAFVPISRKFENERARSPQPVPIKALSRPAIEERSRMIPYTEVAHGAFTTRLYDARSCRLIVDNLRRLDGWAMAQVQEDTADGGSKIYIQPETREVSILYSDHGEKICRDFDQKIDSIIKPLIKEIWGVDFKEHWGTQILRYAPGGHYIAHTDAGGDLAQRYFTVVCYLNDDFEGGRTGFPSLNYSMTPQCGKALFFPAKYFHCAEPVISGEKYVIVSWIIGAPPIKWL